MVKTTKAADAFAKAAQKRQMADQGTTAKMPKEMGKYNAFMSNDGAKAKAAARKLTAGLDKKAFPVS